MRNVQLTKKQTERMHLLVSCFAKRGTKSPAMPPEFVLMLNTIKSMIEDNIPFNENELNILKYLLDCYFGVFSEDDVDPLSEQAYAKITGHWSEAFDEPYYDRCITHAESVGYSFKKSSREKLGY
jgi:hypothetical protein